MPQRHDFWQDSAACADVTTGLFYPESGMRQDEAKRICAACPVRTECLDDALRRDERFGIWGGLNANERDQLAGRRSPRRSAARRRP